MVGAGVLEVLGLGGGVVSSLGVELVVGCGVMGSGGIVACE